jgi:hypothetical protein
VDILVKTIEKELEQDRGVGKNRHQLSADDDIEMMPEPSDNYDDVDMRSESENSSAQMQIDNDSGEERNSGQEMSGSVVVEEDEFDGLEEAAKNMMKR